MMDEVRRTGSVGSVGSVGHTKCRGRRAILPSAPNPTRTTANAPFGPYLAHPDYFHISIICTVWLPLR